VLVTPRYDLEEQVGLLTAHRQVADLVDDQQLVRVDRTMRDFSIATLALRGFGHQHAIGLPALVVSAPHSLGLTWPGADFLVTVHYAAKQKFSVRGMSQLSKYRRILTVN
jgi:hypothetical protein